MRRRPTATFKKNGSDNARFQYSGPVGGDGGERDGRDLPPDGDPRPRSTCCDRAATQPMPRSLRSPCSASPSRKAPGSAAIALFFIQRAALFPSPSTGPGAPPQGPTVDWYVEHGIDEIGVQTPHAVTVPGAIDAWCTFNREYGTRPLGELIEPAARAAEDGYIVTPAHRRRLASLPAETARPGNRRLVLAWRQAARRRRQDAQSAARRHLAPDRAGRPRGVLQRRGHAARSSAGSTRSAGCTEEEDFRGPTLELGRTDPRLLSRL